MAKILLTCILLVFCASVSVAYRILVIFPFPVRSINLLGEEVVRNYLKAGHEVSRHNYLFNYIVSYINIVRCNFFSY
jgi:hypothetical protein